MKQRTKTTYCGAALALALIASPGTSRAELSGSISLDLNSHFISYGADVWAAGGDDGWSFNPTLSLGYTLNEQVSFNAGIWMDANSIGARSFGVAETDTWIGVAYDAGLVTGSVTLQNWQYLGTSEEILDFGLSVDAFLSPSLTLHKRLSAGASGGMNGWFAVFNAAHSIDVTEQISVTIPAQIGFALSDFHRSPSGTKETGYGFANIGVSVSYALTESASVNANVKYWDTDGGVTGNADNDFITYGVGASFAF